MLTCSSNKHVNDKISMIFKTNDDKTGITNIFKEYSKVKDLLNTLDKETTRNVIKAFNNTSLSVDDLSDKFGGLDTSVMTYLNTTKRGKASLQDLKASLDNSSSSMGIATIKAKALSIALNALTGLALTTAIKGIIWIFDELITTLDEQREKLDRAKTSYSESCSELEQLNKELKTARERVDELNNKENLTFTEKDELKKLKETNDELERKIFLLEKANQESEIDVANEAQNLYNKYTNGRVYDLGEQVNFYENSSLLKGVNWDDYKNDISWLIAQYNNQQALLKNAQNNGWDSLVQKAKDNMVLLEGYMADASNEYTSLYETISGLNDISMTPELESAKSDLNEILNLVATILGYEGELKQSSFEDIWDLENFSKYKDEIIELSKNGELTPDVLSSNEYYKKLLEETGLTADETAEHINSLVNEIQSSTLKNETPTLSISDTIDQLNTQLKPAFDSLKSAYQDIFTDDGFTLSNVDISMLDSIKSSIDSLNEMDGVEIDYSSFENLAKVLTDTSSTSAEVRDSINVLATDIVNSLNPALKDVTGESYQLVQQMLESLGVQNAEQVMLSSLGYTYEEYTAAKQECANAGFDLANATEEEIVNFIAEQGGAENCGEALALLQLKKLLLNTTRIDQTSDINNILTLAGAAGVASDSMVKLANAKTLLDTAIANNDSRGIAVAKQELIDAGKAAKDSVLDFKPVELNFSPASSTSSKGSGSKSEKDTHLEAYKKELAELEHLHNMELITNKEFYDRLRDLNEKYFNDTAEHHEKYLDEYQSNEEKIFKGLKQVYQDSLEEHKSMMDSAASHAQRVLDKEIDKLKSDSKTTIKHYEQRIDAIDKEIDAKQGIIDKYQDELDAMELANQKRKDAIALQKAQYELDRAQNQRTIGQYQNGQKVYLTDGKAVRDAEDVRDEADYNIKKTEIQEKISLVQKEIDALEAKQDRLQAKIDQENHALDAQIEKLEAYKERWAEIAEKQTIAQEEAAFLAICGAEGEAEILAMREGILQGFSDNYDAITTNLADLAQANADRMAEIASQMETAASRAAKAASDMAKAQASMASPKGEKYASGTKSAKRGLNLVAENKPEAIIDNDGVRLITKPTLLQMSGGEQVLNGKETETLLDGGTSLSPRIKELLSRSQIESIGNFANMNVMPSFQHNVKLPSFDFSKLQVREVAPTPVVQEINMTLPNVTNESGAQYIINTLNRLPLDTLQYSNRR